jgi:hypothetical protein
MTAPAPTYLQLVPFLYELRESADAGVYQFASLKEAAKAWMKLDAELHTQLQLPPEQFDHDTWVAVGEASIAKQSNIFDALDAFLSPWMRTSQILFPTIKSGAAPTFKSERARILQDAVGVGSTSLLANRDLRDSWTHFDERLDAAVQGGYAGNRHAFVRTSGVAARLDNTLRLVDVETLTIHYRARDGQKLSQPIEPMEQALRSLHASIPGAFSRLQALAP